MDVIGELGVEVSFSGAEFPLSKGTLARFLGIEPLKSAGVPFAGFSTAFLGPGGRGCKPLSDR